MGIIYDDNGINIKKLFKKQVIPYSEIKSIVIMDTENVATEYAVTKKDGEVITYKEGMFTKRDPLYRAIKKYNIYFKDEEEYKKAENLYSEEDINKMIVQVQAFVNEYSRSYIRERLGEEFDIDTVVRDEGQYISIYLRVTANGQLVIVTKDDSPCLAPDEDMYAFDDIVMGYLIEWDGCGRYGITEEMKNRVACEEYLRDTFKYVFE